MSTFRSVISSPNLQMGRPLWFFLLLILMFSGLPIRAQESYDSKGIVVAPIRSGAGLNVIFEPLKTTYRVREPIGFRVKGNKTFFLYVYSIDERTGDAVLILPNRQQSGNKYPPGRFFDVPGINVEFYSDEPGRERIVMIASTRYIDVDRARYKAFGNFATTKSLALENTLQEKGIYIRRANRQRNRKEVVVEEANLTITGEPRRLGDRLPRVPGYEGRNSPIAFVSTARDHYFEGEQFPVVFGADQPGWVNVYVVEPGGRYALLTREQVDGDRIYRVTAQSNAPYGAHRLVAVFSDNGRVDETLLSDFSSGHRGKSLSLVSDAPNPYAVRNFRIEPRR